MSESAYYLPSAEVSAALSKAFEILRRHHFHAFKFTTESSEAALTLQGEWAQAMVKRGISLVAYPKAATEWVTTKAKSPKAAEFASFAYDIDIEERSKHRLDLPAPMPQPVQREGYQHAKHVYDAVGKNMWLVQEVFGVLAQENLITKDLTIQEVDVAIKLVLDRQKSKRVAS